jgi:hypothetical protein
MQKVQPVVVRPARATSDTVRKVTDTVRVPEEPDSTSRKP